MIEIFQWSTNTHEGGLSCRKLVPIQAAGALCSTVGIEINRLLKEYRQNKTSFPPLKPSSGWRRRPEGRQTRFHGLIKDAIDSLLWSANIPRPHIFAGLRM